MNVEEILILLLVAGLVALGFQVVRRGARQGARDALREDAGARADATAEPRVPPAARPPRSDGE